jgi:hypothetical protein
VDLHVSGFGDEVLIGVRGNEMETVKLAIALLPVSLLICGSLVMFRTTRSIRVSCQLLGSMFLGVVFSAHVCEALGIFP